MYANNWQYCDVTYVVACVTLMVVGCMDGSRRLRLGHQVTIMLSVYV